MQTVKRNYDFPEPDLLISLVEIFFRHISPMVPLLHRPTFMKAITNGSHFSDDKFGAVVLLVCAIASRSSDDPRILTEGGSQLRNAGWKWFSQVESFSKPVLSRPELSDLQIIAVSVPHFWSPYILALTNLCYSFPRCISKVHYHPKKLG